MLTSLPPSLEYYDYAKCSWAALMTDDIHTLLLRRHPKSISKLFAAHMSPCEWACPQLVQTQGAPALGLLTPLCARGAPTARPGLCQLQERQQNTEIDLPGLS